MLTFLLSVNAWHTFHLSFCLLLGYDCGCSHEIDIVPSSGVLVNLYF